MASGGTLACAVGGGVGTDRLVCQMTMVSVVYVGVDGAVFAKTLEVGQECTILQVIELSKIVETVGDELSNFHTWLQSTDPSTPPNHKAWFVGVFSLKKPLNYIVQDGDRVEIYRPLVADPMKQRKLKSKKRPALKT